MQFGVGCGYINKLDFVVQAENLGFDFAWFPDTHLIVWHPDAVSLEPSQAIPPCGQWVKNQ